MTKASDNAFPSLLITEGTEPSAPAAGKQRLYIDSTTHKLKRTDSSAVDVTIEGAASGAVTASGLTMTTARLLGRTTASTGAIEEITVGSGLSLSAGSLTATGGGGGLLGLTAYATAGDNTISVTATSDADVDATNLQVTFIAPASGNVLCKLSSLYNDGGNNVHWTIRESTTTLGDNYMSSAVNKATRGIATIYISGISGGSHTYKFGGYTSAGTMSIHHGSTSAKFGYVIMEVWSAP